MILISNIHIVISLFFLLTIFKFYKEKSDYILIISLLFFYLFNDIFRFSSQSQILSNAIIITKDVLLLLYFIINFNLIKKNLKDLKTIHQLIFCLIFFLLINFIFMKQKALFIVGVYDLLFFPFLIFALSIKNLELSKLFIIFEYLACFVIFIFFIQFIDKELYFNFFTNNFDENTFKVLFDEKSYNPILNNYTSKHISLYSSVFNNPGRFNHFLPILFLIMGYFYIMKTNNRSIIYMFLILIITVLNSSRFSLILIFMPIGMIILSAIFSKKHRLKKISFFLLMIFMYLASFTFFNKLHTAQVDEKVSNNKLLIVVYHNFYEPIISVFDKERSKTPSSIVGRLAIIQNHSYQYFIINNEEITVKKYLFGHGLGKHSMGTKFFNGKEFYIYENGLIILFYELGLINLLILFFIYLFIAKIYMNKIELLKNKMLNVFFKTIILFPFLLSITGFQFYRDYAFQFFYFFLIAMIVNFAEVSKNRKLTHQ